MLTDVESLFLLRINRVQGQHTLPSFFAGDVGTSGNIIRCTDAAALAVYNATCYGFPKRVTNTYQVHREQTAGAVISVS